MLSKKTYSSFCDLGSCLITCEDRNHVIYKHKLVMHNHCQTIKNMMRIDRRENLSKNEALKESLHREKRLLYSFLSSVKIKNPQNEVWWGISHVATSHSIEPTRCSQNKIVMTLGYPCDMKTFIDRTRSLVDKMDLIIITA